VITTSRSTTLANISVVGVYLLLASVILMLLAPVLAGLFTLCVAEMAGHVMWLLAAG
jgi:hypothetical protein